MNAISPGYTETDITKGMPAAVVDQLKVAIPLGWVFLEEVAAAVPFSWQAPAPATSPDR